MSKVINAAYLGAISSNPAELLKTARQCLLEAESRAESLERLLRSRMAEKLRLLRICCRQAAQKTSEQQLNEALRLSKQTLEKSRKELVKELSRQSLNLALSIAEEIIGEAIERKPQSLLNRIKKALNEIKPRQINEICVAHGYSSKQVKEIAAVTEDDSIPAGDAVVKTNTGRITLSWKAHLGSISDRLRADLEQRLSASSEEGLNACTSKP